jgi:hypothetical protein
MNSSGGIIKPTLQSIPDSNYSMLSAIDNGSPSSMTTRKISSTTHAIGNPETPNKGASYFLQKSKQTADTLGAKYLTLLGVHLPSQEPDESQVSLAEVPPSDVPRGSVKTQLVPHPASSIANMTSSNLLGFQKQKNADKAQ